MIRSILWESAAEFLRGVDRDPGASIQEIEHDVRLARIEEWRTLAAQRRVEHHQRRIEQSKPTRWDRPKTGDLVLLRRYALDTQKGQKLEPRWQGPYQVQALTRNGQSLKLADFQSGQSIGRHHVDNCKVYRLRKKGHGLQATVDLSAQVDNTWAQVPPPSDNEETRRDDKPSDEGDPTPPGAHLAHREEQRASYWRHRELNLEREYQHANKYPKIGPI